MPDFETARLAPWRIYALPGRWPEVPGLMFLPAAAALVAETLFDVNASDFAATADPIDLDEVQSGEAGIAGSAARFVADLLSSGSLSCRAQRMGGGDPVEVARDEWTPERAREAVSTGLIRRRVADGRILPQWVLVGTAEMEMVAEIYGTEISEDGGLALRNRLATIVLGNLSAIVRNQTPPPGDAAARRLVSVLLPSTRPSLSPDDRAKLKAAIALWLQERFADDPHQRLGREGYETLIQEKFGDTVSEAMAGEIWRLATADKPHSSRREPGRRPKGVRDRE